MAARAAQAVDKRKRSQSGKSSSASSTASSKRKSQQSKDGKSGTKKRELTEKEAKSVMKSPVSMMKPSEAAATSTMIAVTTEVNDGCGDAFGRIDVLPTVSPNGGPTQRTLLRLGLRSRRLVHASMLTAVHRRRRQEFARQYRNWTSTDKHPATIAGRVQAGPFHRLFSAMDPQPRNLAQLATALESAWLNIPVNTFRNLIDSVPARRDLAAVRSAKGGYSGF
ncbi:hypothetical protein HPB49_018729 [Dermacentor silvarum]|uniref:Uncharacterized protein n=1 Tax=Dermacentor silvarum TaxID=543639 RepID=A0ACB8D7B0_DERSI|nr:hypothetical protein HPB49_018729 [Dermacentor silvarum]